MQTSNMFSELITRITEIGHSLTKGMDSSEISLQGLCEQLLSGKGEATGLAIAHEILSRYDKLIEDEKKVFFISLSTDFGVNEQSLKVAINEWQEKGKDVERNIHFATEPQSIELIRRLNRVSGATSRLVSMRNDLLLVIKKDTSKNMQLKQLDYDFQHLFGSWFNRGFLELKNIDWSTPAEILERIIEYEAVHEITGWDDLRRRVSKPNRRLYAYFHPSMGEEPLIFVEVALLENIPNAIKPILSEDADEEVDLGKLNTAAFYSISNCQPGLRGISFGNFLIKQAVIEIRRELPNIKNFVTLSPVTGFRRWVESQVEKNFENENIDSKHQYFLQKLVAASNETDEKKQDKDKDEGDNLSELLRNKDTLSQALAYYLVTARSVKNTIIDPVARFHLGNGARLEKLHANSDLSQQGMRNSWGLMVNYLYDLDDIEVNHETFANSGDVVRSSQVNNFLKATK